MKVAIHKDRYGKLNYKIEKYLSILEYNDIEAVLVDVSDSNFWNIMKSVDYFIFRFSLYDDQKQIAQDIIPVIDKYYKAKIFPDANTCWAYDDKIKETFLLNNESNVFVDTWIFYDKKAALSWMGNAEFPLVFKLKSGSKSTNIFLINNKKECEKIINKMFGKGVYSGNVHLNGSVFYKDMSIKNLINILGSKIKRYINDEDIQLYWSIQKNYLLLQKFLPNNYYDTRITTIGKRAFGARRYTRDGDFRASGSGKLVLDKEKIDLRMIDIALRISSKYNFQTMAYDFIYNESHQPRIVEMSYNYPDRAIERSEGFWDIDFIYHRTQNCPEYYHLIDLLNIPFLKVPPNLKLAPVK